MTAPADERTPSAKLSSARHQFTLAASEVNLIVDHAADGGTVYTIRIPALHLMAVGDPGEPRSRVEAAAAEALAEVADLVRSLVRRTRKGGDASIFGADTATDYELELALGFTRIVRRAAKPEPGGWQLDRAELRLLESWIKLKLGSAAPGIFGGGE